MAKERLSGARGRHGAGGNVIVELALVLPFLLLVVAGIVDLGQLYWEKHVITNATREGARAAAKADITADPNQPSPPKEKTKAAVMQIVQNYLNNFHVKDPDGNPLVLEGGVNFSYTWDPATSPMVLTVELKDIRVKMMLMPNIQGLLGGGGGSDPVILKASTTMAAEWETPPGS
jgi:Flp pilus assembly protein TadG